MLQNCKIVMICWWWNSNPQGDHCHPQVPSLLCTPISPHRQIDGWVVLSDQERRSTKNPDLRATFRRPALAYGTIFPSHKSPPPSYSLLASNTLGCEEIELLRNCAFSLIIRLMSSPFLANRVSVAWTLLNKFLLFGYPPARSKSLTSRGDINSSPTISRQASDNPVEAKRFCLACVVLLLRLRSKRLIATVTAFNSDWIPSICLFSFSPIAINSVLASIMGNCRRCIYPCQMKFIISLDAQFFTFMHKISILGKNSHG
jgi:hypothetical protein